jgi:hypothetical protein
MTVIWNEFIADVHSAVKAHDYVNATLRRAIPMPTIIPIDAVTRRQMQKSHLAARSPSIQSVLL